MKKMLFTMTLTAALLLGMAGLTGCGKRPKYNTQNEIPTDASVFELYRVGYDFWGGNHYVEVLAGEMEADGFKPLGGELAFRLDKNEFSASFWEPHGTGLTEKTVYWGGKEFYEDYYRETLSLVDEFYPVPSYYEFGEDDKLIYLDEVRSEIDSPALDE